LYKVESFSENMPCEIEVRILIPPFTNVFLTCIDSDTDTTFQGTANLTGRVYGAV